MITSLCHIFFIASLLFIVSHTSCVSLASFKAFFKQKEMVVQNDKIGIVKLAGKINAENVEKIIKKVETFIQDPAVKGVLFVINSSGGPSAAGELLFREISELTKVKPVVSFATVDCTSAAYHAAIGSNWIIALSSSSVGSIGTVITVERHAKTQTKNNNYEAETQYELIAAGKYKAMYHSNSAALTEEERDHVKGYVNEIYKLFYTAVAQQRNLSVKQLGEWADGQCFNGEKALRLGLIDQVGGYSDAVRKLKELIEQSGIKLNPKFVFVE